jgi:hypothetical protein
LPAQPHQHQQPLQAEAHEQGQHPEAATAVPSLPAGKT